MDELKPIQQDMIRKSSRIFGFIVLILWFLALSMGMKAQGVVRKGNTFVAKVDTTKKATYTKTVYTYKDATGEYPIYLSSAGKAFILKTSKKTGKEYRRYLPEVTAQLNKK